jgi:rubrerythrin
MARLESVWPGYQGRWFPYHQNEVSMHIFEIAMQMEEEGEQFYRGLADKTQNKGLKRIFTLLADEERMHYRLFDALHRRADPDIAEGQLEIKVDRLFREIHEQEAHLTGDSPQEDVYEAALADELKTVALYREFLGKAETEAQRKALQKVIKEEEEHVRVLENMVEYLRRPDLWMENAEFVHIEEY